MDKTIENEQTIRVLEGRIDAHTVGPIEKWLETQSAESPARILLDMRGVTFIDTRVIAVLVRTMKHCRQQTGDLVLCDLSQPVRVIFELMRLDKAFTIADSVEEAHLLFS